MDKWQHRRSRGRENRICGDSAACTPRTAAIQKPFKVNPIKQAPQPPRKFKSLRIIPLGGLDEVGKNMMVFEYDQDIVIVDMGLQFPEEDMLGIDYVIPDISYLAGKESRIRGVLITHTTLTTLAQSLISFQN